MGLEAGIFGLLSTAESLIALQGARVYPILLPSQPVLPATTYQIVGGSQAATFATSGQQRRRVQFDFFADYEQGTYDQAVALRDATIALLNGFQGALPNGLYVEIDFHQSIDHFENEARQYRCTAEFYVHFVL